MSTFSDYFKGKWTIGRGDKVNDPLEEVDVEGAVKPQTTEKPVTVPEIDTSDAIGSMATMLGPTPEERKAEQDRQDAHHKKMKGWASLFNGLAHLGNLYYTARGATPQQLADPTKQMDQDYLQERQRLDAQQKERRQYYQDLWNMQRQAKTDAMNTAYRQAQIETMRSKEQRLAELSEIDKQIKEAEAAGKLANVALLEEKRNRIVALLPYETQVLVARSNASNSAAAASAARARKTNIDAGGTTTTVTKGGETITKVTKPNAVTTPTPKKPTGGKKRKKINW